VSSQVLPLSAVRRTRVAVTPQPVLALVIWKATNDKLLAETRRAEAALDEPTPTSTVSNAATVAA
jgi:hypothetical protein